jgi:hypothetical protein
LTYKVDADTVALKQEFAAKESKEAPPTDFI